MDSWTYESIMNLKYLDMVLSGRYPSLKESFRRHSIPITSVYLIWVCFDANGIFDVLNSPKQAPNCENWDL